jgi:hypothetical protein
MSLSYTNMKLLCPCAAEVYAYAAVCYDSEKHTRHTIICWSCDKPLGVVPARMLFVGETACEAKAESLAFLALRASSLFPEKRVAVPASIA